MQQFVGGRPDMGYSSDLRWVESDKKTVVNPTKADDVEKLLQGDCARCDACGDITLKTELEDQWSHRKPVVTVRPHVFVPGKAHTDYWTDDAVFGHFFHCPDCAESWSNDSSPWDTIDGYKRWRATRERKE
jgi:hypothetical protein